MEKVKLLELDIDAEALIKKAADARQALEDLKVKAAESGTTLEALKVKLAESETALDRLKAKAAELQEAMAEGEIQIISYTQTLANLAAQGQANSEQNAKTLQELEQLKLKYEQKRIALVAVNQEMAAAVTHHSSLSQEVTTQTKVVNSSATAVNALTGELETLDVTIAETTTSVKTSAKEEVGMAIASKTSTQAMAAQVETLGELSAKTEEAKEKKLTFLEALKSTVSVSNEFSSEMNKSVEIFPGITTSLEFSTKGLKDYSKQQWAAALSTEGTSKATKIFNAALVSTGIGAIVVALGLLVAGLSQSKQFTEAFTKVLAPVQGVFKGIVLVIQTLADNFSEMADGVFGQFKDNFTILSNLFLIGVDNMRLAWSKLIGDQEGVNEIQDKIKERQEEINNALIRTAERNKAVVDFVKRSYDTIKEAAKVQSEIAELTSQIEEKESEMIKIRSEAKSQLEAQKKIAEDVNKTEAERKAAAEEAYRISQNLVEKEKELLDLKIKQKEKEYFLSGQNADVLKELNELKAKNNELGSQGNKVEEDRSKTIQSIINSEKAKRIAAWDAAIKKSEEALDLYIAQESGKQKSLQQTLDFEKNVYDKKQAILEQQLKSGKISQTKYETDILNLKNDYLQKTAMATVDNLTSEMELYVAQHQSKIDSESQLTDELVKEEENRLATIYDKKSAILKTQRDKDLISEKDFLLQKIELDKEYEDQKEALSEQYKEQQKENENQQKAEKVAKIKEEYEEKIANEANQWEVQRLQAEERYALEHEDLLDRYHKKELTKEEFDAYEKESEQRKTDDIKKINQAEFDNKLNLAKDTLSNITSLLGEHTAAGKAAAIAQTTIDTYKAAQAAYSSLAGIPVVGPALGAVAAAAAISSGIANVKKITSTKTPKAEHGAVFTIGGKRHSNGGTKFYGEDGTTFEAEQGEKMFVLNRRASAAMAPLLSGINQRFGGVSLASASGYLAAGGQVLRNSAGVAGTNNLKIDYDLLANRIGQSVSAANSQLPPPVVAVTDINYGQSSYARVVNGASI